MVRILHFSECSFRKVFTIEFLIRFWAFGMKEWARSGWNVFDFLLVLISLVDTSLRFFSLIKLDSAPFASANFRVALMIFAVSIFSVADHPGALGESIIPSAGRFWRSRATLHEAKLF